MPTRSSSSAWAGSGSTQPVGGGSVGTAPSNWRIAAESWWTPEPTRSTLPAPRSVDLAAQALNR